MKLFSLFSTAVSETSVQQNDWNRTYPDRRKKPTSPWAAFWPTGRRMVNRRAEEHSRPYFVDRFSTITFIFILLLLLASIADAYLTIHLMNAGAQEINPLMDSLLSRSVHHFMLGKYLLTVAGLPLLLIFQNHYLFGTRLRVRHLIPVAVALYCILIGYQLTLVQKYTEPPTTFTVVARPTTL